MLKPTRIVNNVRSSKNTGAVPSNKMNKNIGYESLLERDYIYMLEYDKNISCYGEQPITIDFKSDGKKRRYTPDFYFETFEGDKYLVEIKPKNKLIQILHDRNLRASYDAAYMYGNKNGMKFIIVTDEDMKHGNILENIKYLQSYAHIKVPINVEQIIEEILKVNTNLTISELIAMIDVKDDNYAYGYIMNMLYTNKIYMNMSENLLKDKGSVFVFRRGDSDV